MRWIHLLILFPLLVVACEQEGCNAECAECQSALDHLQDRILENSCNVTWMDDAMDRVEEDCADHDPFKLIGAIDEWCSALPESGGTPQVQCEFPGATRMYMAYQVDASFAATFPSGVVFAIYVAGQQVDELELSAADYGFFRFHPLTAVNDGDDFQVELRDLDDPETPLHTGTAQLWIRQTGWDDRSGRSVRLTTNTDGVDYLLLSEFD